MTNSTTNAARRDVTKHQHDYRCKYSPDSGWHCSDLTQEKYRISFEFVNPISYPSAYYNEQPCMRVSDVPADWWQTVRRESYSFQDIENQLVGLKSEIAKGELIRNPVIEKCSVYWEKLYD